MTALDVDETARFRDIIAERLGLHFEESRLGFLHMVLEARAAACSCSLADYLDRIASHGEKGERGALAQALTVPETYFFRHMDQFDAMRDVALPACMARTAPSRRLRILSAGCASGEEAYTLAMLIREADLDPSWQISIRAVDLCPAILRKAATGRFSSWALRETPAHLRDRWFRQEGREFALDMSIRKAVTFEEHNLIDDGDALWPTGGYDIIFCRNVLMYLTPAHMRRVVGYMARALAPGGYLFLGHAETLRNKSEGFELCQSHGSFYYRRAGWPGHGAITETASQKDWRAPSRVGTAATPHANTIEGAGWFEAIGQSSGRIEQLARRGAAAIGEPAGREDKSIIEQVLGLLAQERFAAALTIVDGQAEGSTAHPLMATVRAALLAHMGRFAEAEIAARDLLAADHRHVGAHYILALCRERAGDPEGAADHARSAARLDANFAMPRLHLGLQARKAGDLALARRELSRALTLLHGEETVRIMLFGGGFTRQALITLCDSALRASGARP